jgi:hypothetical protein
MTTAEKIARLLNTDWRAIDAMLRMGFTEVQIIRSYLVPAVS